MKDFRNTSIDSILKDYFHCISRDRLLDDNIDIGDPELIENSKAKYLQLFAKFLNNAYFKGYYIAEDIIKKLMDIIDFEGFEYVVMEKYYEILNSAMNDYKITEYEEYPFTPEEAKDFIQEYLASIQGLSDKWISSYIVAKRVTSHKYTQLVRLDQELFPIDLIYKNIGNVTNKEQFVEYAYILYQNNKSAYRSLLNNEKINKYYYTFFLLENTNYSEIDIIINNATTLDSLLYYINIYTQFNYKDGNHSSQLPDQVNDNIRRIFELLTINMSIEQTAMIVGMKYDEWREYCDNNYHELNTLLLALNLYQSDQERFKILNPLDYFYKIKNCYPNDEYFYYRYSLLNMDYKLLCDNFAFIIYELYNNMNQDLIIDLINDCINGLVGLRNRSVDNYLIELSQCLSSFSYSISNNTNMIINNNHRLDIVITNNYKDKGPLFGETGGGFIKLINIFIESIRKSLLGRNGKFDPEWIPKQNDEIAYDYKYCMIGESLTKDTRLFNSVVCPSAGSVIENVRSINSSVEIIDAYLDEKFNKCFESNAVYIAKYIKPKSIDDSSFVNIIYGDNNYKLETKIPMYLECDKEYLLGLYNVSTSEFIYANCIYDTENAPEKLKTLSIQMANGISLGEECIMSLAREDSSVYYYHKYIDNYDDVQVQAYNYRLELNNQYQKDDGKRLLIIS